MYDPELGYVVMATKCSWRPAMASAHLSGEVGREPGCGLSWDLGGVAEWQSIGVFCKENRELVNLPCC